MPWRNLETLRSILIVAVVVISASIAILHKRARNSTSRAGPAAGRVVQETHALDASAGGESKNPSLKAELSLPEAGVKQGELAAVDIRITNTSGRPLDILRPYFICLLPLHAAELFLLDEDGGQIADFFDYHSGSDRGIVPSNWIHLPPGGSFLAVFRFWVTHPPDFPPGNGPRLPPGKYFLELVLRERTISTPPFKDGSKPGDANIDDWVKMQAFCSGFPGPEICRSNRVELTILPPTGN